MKMRFYALWLSLICAVVYLVQFLFPSFTSLFILDRHFSYQIWRFVTAIFLHGSLAHLVLNLFALALFGTILESLIGSRRLLLVFFVSGIAANIIASNYYSSSLGASGAIYGVLGALIFIRPLMVVWVYGLPMPMFLAGIIWIAGDVTGLFLPSDIGHIAHLSGIAIGFIFGFCYRKDVKNAQRQERIQLHEGYMRQWEDTNIRKG